jgi:hypothetical protein
VFDNVVVQPRDAREASDVFYRQRLGDVLLTYENEVVLTNEVGVGLHGVTLVTWVLLLNQVKPVLTMRWGYRHQSWRQMGFGQHCLNLHELELPVGSPVSLCFDSGCETYIGKLVCTRVVPQFTTEVAKPLTL